MTTLNPTEYLQTSPWKPAIFKDRVAFVTGGAGTICRVQVEALVILGCHAVIIGRNEAKTLQAATEIQLLNPDVKVLGIGNIDVREIADLQKAVKLTVETLGKIDYVIAGAAGNFLADFNHLSSNAFKTVVDIDLLGAFNTTKACYDQLVKSNVGSIIYVSATLHYYGIPFQAHVSAAKAGIDALSAAMAVELGPMGVRSNVIAPGGIEATEGLSRLLPKENIDQARKRVPLGRFGKTRDIADATVWLFSQAASYVSGTVVVVDGAGWHTGNSIAASGDTSIYPDMLVKRLKEKSKI
ncbi:NAD(P)-binding protein [Nadsonia fulvescens var. elongata DSM 6958]|uniref:2,4-dienoyl-CoA reductase [(3E)-enoyl-CoA-producing] n=1 Tax=Nadsonia fulvescens var. elongata DSM 6958 TaxID=857566 RepID=A0A1E3PH09_9ASCO|nr:NAD(P)-binding protein [Nadsonia fulvescens var. elongata DSM 6958]